MQSMACQKRRFSFLSSVRSQIPLKNRELVEWIIWYSQTGDHKYDDDEIEAAFGDALNAAVTGSFE